ncbi:MAG TPA: DUF4388 domain-containing protein [Ktedonobacterales bacterium]|nr:DUF4388 domain-containing protein [Ktedonobacterales bacterium]
MALAGTLRQTNLEDVLRLINEQQGAGLLVVRYGNLFAELYVRAGYVLCVQRSGVGQSFSERLVNARLVTPQQLGYVRALYQEKPITSEVDLARALLQCNYLTERELRDWVADDVIELLVVALSWDDGEFEFLEHEMPIPGRMVIEVPISIVLDEALRHLAQRRQRVSAARVAVTLDLVLGFAEEPPPTNGKVQLTPDQWRFLTVINGKTPLWEACKILHLPQPGALRLASELLSSGILVVSGLQRDAEGRPAAPAENMAPVGPTERPSHPRQSIPLSISGSTRVVNGYDRGRSRFGR